MMSNKTATYIVPGILALSLMLAGCNAGTQSTSGGSGTASRTVSGVASTGSPAPGVVSLKDSSTPPQERIISTNSKGAYSIDTSGLTAPFVLKAEWSAETENSRLYSISAGNGTTNINPITNAAVSAASENDDADGLYHAPDPDRNQRTKIKFRDIIDQLRVVLAPLFALYETSKDPVTESDDDDDDDNNENDNTGLHALLRDVKFSVNSGMLIVTNKRTRGVIYEAPLNDIASGTFHPENMPNQPSPQSGTMLYANWCASCHGPLASSSKKNATATAIQTAIDNNTGGMGSITLTPQQVQAIASALSTSTTPSTPAPNGAALYASNCGTCHNALASSTKKNATASAIRTAITNNVGGMGSLSLTDAEVQAIADALVAAAPPAACVYTYSIWGACQPNGIQTRSLISTTPAGCTGTPVLRQSCNYVPPIDGAALYSQYCSGCHGNGKKGKSTTAIQNAITNNTGGMGSAALRALTPEQIAAISAAP